MQNLLDNQYALIDAERMTSGSVSEMMEPMKKVTQTSDKVLSVQERALNNIDKLTGKAGELAKSAASNNAALLYSSSTEL